MIEPLLNLIEKLESETKNIGYPNEVQTSPREYGYCTAIIALAVIILESAVNRVRDIRQDESKPAVQYLQAILSDSLDFVAELFVIRDAIVHAHNWEGIIQDDDENGLHFADRPNLPPQYGDKKYRHYVDPELRQTKTLRLNVIPTRIWRDDVLKVLVTLELVLRKLYEIAPHHVGVTAAIFKFHGEYVSLQSAVARMVETKLCGTTSGQP